MLDEAALPAAFSTSFTTSWRLRAAIFSLLSTEDEAAAAAGAEEGLGDLGDLGGLRAFSATKQSSADQQASA
jgi:hypothetical protein